MAGEHTILISYWDTAYVQQIVKALADKGYHYNVNKHNHYYELILL